MPLASEVLLLRGKLKRLSKDRRKEEMVAFEIISSASAANPGQ